MNKEIEDKLKKIQELINRGSTPGERKAAQIAFDNICEKYNIDKDKVGKKKVEISLNTKYEKNLFGYIYDYFIEKGGGYSLYGISKKHVKRVVIVSLDYDKAVLLECAWAVFKAEEFEKLCEYAAENCTTFAHFKATKEEWMKMLGNGFVCHQEGKET